MSLNGVTVAHLALSPADYVSTRFGPFVFNAGDVVGNSGVVLGAAPLSLVMGLSGFLYDLSTRKVPLNQKLITGASSYVVPAGKHVVANYFTVNRTYISIDGVEIASLNARMFSAINISPVGPFVVNSGSVFSVDMGIPHPDPLFGLLSGFLYNN